MEDNWEKALQEELEKKQIKYHQRIDGTFIENGLDSWLVSVCGGTYANDETRRVKLFHGNLYRRSRCKNENHPGMHVQFVQDIAIGDLIHYIEHHKGKYDHVRKMYNKNGIRKTK